MLRDGARYSVASAQRQVKGLKDYIPTGPNFGLTTKWNLARKRVALEKKSDDLSLA
jgi:hypothetical protein